MRSVFTAALMPDTNVDTPDTFSGTVLFRVTKTTRYAARLPLWQWKQWLNRGTDWNNPSVCPLVPQTSCLTKLNPCWCWAFRPVSLCFCLTLFFSSVLSFCLSGWAQVHSSGHWVLAQSIFFFFCTAMCTATVRRRRRIRGGDGEGDRKDAEGWTESRIRGKVKQAWNRELKTECTGNNTVVTLKGKKKRGGVRKEYVSSSWKRVKGEGERETRVLEKIDCLWCTSYISLLSDSKHPCGNVSGGLRELYVEQK